MCVYIWFNHDFPSDYKNFVPIQKFGFRAIGTGDKVKLWYEHKAILFPIKAWPVNKINIEQCDFSAVELGSRSCYCDIGDSNAIIDCRKYQNYKTVNLSCYQVNTDEL